MEAQDNYEYQTAGNDMGYDTGAQVPLDDPYAGLDEEAKAALQEEFRQELAKTEEEIATLRQVLASKSKHAAELKRKLGISAWNQWTTDLGQGVKNLQETTAYQKTSEALSGVTEKTTSLFGGLGGSLAKKLGDVKSSTAFKSFEERVGTTIGSVKSKMTGSRSNSTNSFEEALNSMEAQRAQQATGTSVPPTILETNGS